MDKNLLYRSIPKVDIILEFEAIKASIEKYGREIVIDAIRIEMDELRKFIGATDSEEAAKEVETQPQTPNYDYDYDMDDFDDLAALDSEDMSDEEIAVDFAEDEE